MLALAPLLRPVHPQLYVQGQTAAPMPAPIAVAAWFEAGVTSCFTDTGGTTAVSLDGDLVACIKDRDGNILATQATSANRPVYRTNSGKPYLEFDGTKILVSSSGLAVTDTAGQHSSVVAVQFTNNTGVQSAVDADGSPRLSQLLRNNAGTAETIAFDTAVNAYTDSGGTITAATNLVLSEISTASACEAFINGTGNGTTARSGIAQTGSPTFGVGGSNTWGQKMAGRIYGFAVWKGPLSPIAHGNAVTYFQGLYTVSGTTYNDTLSESLTAADALSGTVTFTATISEALTSADSLSGSAIFAASLNETVASADSLSATATFRPTISESVTAADSNAATLTANGTLSESVAGSDSITAAATFNGSLTEGVTASDSLTGGLLLTGTLSETIAASYSLSGLVTFAGPLTETLSASDGLTATATYIASLLETAAVADDYLATSVEPPAPYVPPTIHHGFHKLSLTRITWGPDSAGGAAWNHNDETQNNWSSGSGQSGANWKKS